MPATQAAAPTPARALNTGRIAVWGLYAAVLLVAPLAFSSDFAISMLAQIGIAIVACLSYNILLGQGGMLSFGHAVYTGLGTFVAVQVLSRIASGPLPIPVSLLPIVGGLAGMLFAVVLGFVTTKKSGTTFAMITLGIGELVYAMTAMIPEFFGGEGGVSANRVVGKPFFGITFGPPVQVYYLLAAYTFACTAAMFAFTRTPLGRMLNAVRDNPERVEFIGYSTQRVRFISFIIAGFFAGVAGGMYALNFEIATAEVVGATRSGFYLLFTFLGGAGFFFGPIIGAVLLVLSAALLSEFTKAWQLYYGLVFLFMVMFAPGGIASLIMMNVRVASFGKLGGLWRWYLGLGLAGLAMLAGAAALIEMIYHLQLATGEASTLRFVGLTLDSKGAASWSGALLAVVVGCAAFEWVRRRFLIRWGTVQGDIEAEIRRREVA